MSAWATATQHDHQPVMLANTLSRVQCSAGLCRWPLLRNSFLLSFKSIAFCSRFEAAMSSHCLARRAFTLNLRALSCIKCKCFLLRRSSMTISNAAAAAAAAAAEAEEIWSHTAAANHHRSCRWFQLKQNHHSYLEYSCYSL